MLYVRCVIMLQCVAVQLRLQEIHLLPVIKLYNLCCKSNHIIHVNHRLVDPILSASK